MSNQRSLITGAEFKAFYKDEQVWSYEGQANAFYVEDLVFDIQGQEGLSMEAIYEQYGDDFERLPDDAKIRLESGYMFLHGHLVQPGANPEDDLLVVFDQWQKARNEVTFTASVSVSKNDAQALAQIEQAFDQLAQLGVQVSRSDMEEAPRAKAGGPRP